MVYETCYTYNANLNPISTGLCLHPICTGGEGGKFVPLLKNWLVSDKNKTFCLLELFFVKSFKINFLRLRHHENDDDVIKTSKTLQQHANLSKSCKILFSAWTFVISRTSLIKLACINAWWRHMHDDVIFIIMWLLLFVTFCNSDYTIIHKILKYCSIIFIMSFSSW